MRKLSIEFAGKFGIKIFFVVFLTISCSEKKLEPPSGLLVELLRYPEKAVITDKNPEFSWIVPNNVDSQTAYRVLVASDENLLNDNVADYWDSGKINSNKSISVSFKGKTLEPNSEYWWKVRIWDKNGDSSGFSPSQKFLTSNNNINDQAWPGESKFVKLNDGEWISENRQTASFHKKNPITLIEVDSNKWFADFGKAAFATLRFEAYSGHVKDSAVIYIGERKNNSPTVNKDPGRSNIGFEKFVLNIKRGLHTYEIKIPPHHSNSPNHQKLAPFFPEVLPFRFVELSSINKIGIKKIEQLALYYPFDDNSSDFTSSDSNLNKVWDLCKYTLKATPFLGIYADGNRERMPYEADSYIQQLGHYAVDREYAIARYTADYLIYNPSWPTEWHMHSVLMAWEDYLYTGDKEFIEKNYEQLKNKTLIALQSENGLISTKDKKVTQDFLESINFKGKSIRDIVDWPKGTPIGKAQAGNAGPNPEGERDGYVFTNFNTVVNSFHYRTLVIMSQIANVLKKEDEAKYFEDQAYKVKKSIIDILFDKERGIFKDGEATGHSSLHANMFPMAFGLVPEKHIETVMSFIKSRGMACSVYGAQYLLDALFNAGDDEYAISLLTSEDKRSWMNMLNVGSTMTTEAWDEYFKPNLTWNHAWGSAPANIIVRRLMGVKPIKPGFESFSIIPQPGNLTKVKLKLPSIRGTIICDLKILENLWKMSITVPGNCIAHLYLPDEFQTVISNDKELQVEKTEYYAGKTRNIYFLKSGMHDLNIN